MSDNNKRYQIEISGVEDRLTIIMLLAKNNYSTRLTRVQKGNQKVVVVEYWKEQ